MTMEGYGSATYGDRIADVYDAWYGERPDTDACVTALVDLAAGGPVLELGVGTGRLALPLAARGLTVIGVDASAAMLDQLRAKSGAERVQAIEGDMTGPLPDGPGRPYRLVFCAFNTFFNLTDDDAQRRCLAEVARVLAPDGRFVLEAFVPDPTRAINGNLEVRAIEADRVVLFADRHDPETQLAWSTFVEITPSGTRFRPCHVHYRWPHQLDQLAGEAGLALRERWGGWAGEPFDDDSAAHVSVYVPSRQP